MRIAILTLPLHTNYGGILQAYALQTVLQRMGHEVEVLQKKNTLGHYFFFMPIVYAKRIINKYIFGKKIYIFAEQRDAKLSRNTSIFITSYINNRFIKSLSEIKPVDYDGIVVGSDQIWRRSYFSSQYDRIMLSVNPEDAFLKFTKGWNIKRIAYAPSFGVDNWDYSDAETLEITKLINNFNGVSIREKSGVDNCMRYLSHNAEHVLDPTMILRKEDYNKLIENSDYKKPSQRNKLFCYILDRNINKERIIHDLSLEMNEEPFYMTGDVKNGEMQPYVEGWLAAFRDANLIITDSFHACVFSLIFNKPFIVIGNIERGMSRFNSLLEIFGLKDRLIDETSVSYPSIKIDNWQEINETIEKWREKSFHFLKTSLY